MGGAAKSARAARLKAQLPELEVRLSEARKRKDSDSADSDRMSQRSSAAERSRSCEEELEAVKLQEECKTELPRRMGGASVALWLCLSSVLQLCCSYAATLFTFRRLKEKVKSLEVLHSESCSGSAREEQSLSLSLHLDSILPSRLDRLVHVHCVHVSMCCKNAVTSVRCLICNHLGNQHLISMIEKPF